MVDDESESYRPRRAFVDPNAPAEPPAVPPRARPTDPPASVPDVDEDAPKPLYRDEVGSTSGSVGTPRGTSQSGSGQDRGTDTDTGIRPITFVPRQRRSTFEDEDATTVLPRTRLGGRHTEDRADRFDDYDDDEPSRKPLGQRTKLALLIGAVAAVVVVGLGIGYAVLGVKTSPQGGSTPVSSPGGPGSPTDSASGSPNPVAVLTDDQLLTPAQARVLDPARTWTISLTQRTAGANFPQPACFTPDPVEGEPAPEQRVARVLGSGGKNPPSVLQLATAYGSPEEAGQAYAIAAKTLGGCPVVGSYIASGRVISGLGDQATGVVVNSSNGKSTRVHSMVLSRTGRVVNLLDVAQQTTALSITRTARAVGALTSVQCAAAGGGCRATPTLKKGPPPLGGDQPGFLATGDLPPAGSAQTAWVATSVEPPKDDFLGSGCETVNWATLPAQRKTGRVYLVQDSGKSFFGLNEIVVTMKDAATAQKFVDKIRSDLGSCKERKLTAAVTKPEKVEGVGASNAAISGFTSVVTQKSTAGAQKYRVGIVATGTKAVYTFLNPTGAYDFTDQQWNTVAVRAGERTTQVT